MSDDPASTLALCAWLKKRISEWESAAKAEMTLDVGERKAAKLNGQVIAYTTMTKGTRRMKITDEKRFTDWVAHRWPDEIIEIRWVEPAFKEKLAKQALDLGALIDADGEVCDHVSVQDGTPHLMTKLTDDASIVIAGLLQSGRIGVDGIRSIEAGVE